MRVIIIDNYDSFTYNLVQYIEEILLQEIDVFRNDEIEIEALENYDAIIISPGPGIPSESGITKEIIEKYGPSKCIFGVCLGLQAITEVYGGEIYNLDTVFHGVSTHIEILDKSDIVFKNIESPFEAGRYHSWAAQKSKMPADLIVTAVDEEGSIMAIRHKTHQVYGVQFHPESIMTKVGKDLLKNFLDHAAQILEAKKVVQS
jgi:anthranilate synthase component 2